MDEASELRARLRKTVELLREFIEEHDARAISSDSHFYCDFVVRARTILDGKWEEPKKQEPEL